MERLDIELNLPQHNGHDVINKNEQSAVSDNLFIIDGSFDQMDVPDKIAFREKRLEEFKSLAERAIKVKQRTFYRECIEKEKDAIIALKNLLLKN